MENIFELLTHWIEGLNISMNSLQSTYSIKALIAALIIGPLLGAVGTTVVAKRMAFFSSAIGNSAIAGVAIGVLLSEPLEAPYISLFSFAILFAIFLNFSKNRSGMSNDTLIGVFMATSLAVGSSLMLYVTQKKGLDFHTLDKYLFGDIYALTYKDITNLLITAIFTLGIGLFAYNRIIISGLNSSLAKVRKIPVIVVDYAFVILIALITVASVKIVGAVLVEALLVIPAASAANVSRSLRGFTIWSITFATVAAVCGDIIPAEFELNIPSGGTIIVISAAIFVITMYIKMLRNFPLRSVLIWHIGLLLAFYISNVTTTLVAPKSSIATAIVIKTGMTLALLFPLKLLIDWLVTIYTSTFAEDNVTASSKK